MKLLSHPKRPLSIYLGYLGELALLLSFVSLPLHSSAVCPGFFTLNASSSTLCAGTNTVTLNLVQPGFVGDVAKWQSSPDGVAWSDVASTDTFLVVNNLTDTTYYRLISTTDACTTSAIQIDVAPASVGGTAAILGATQICATAPVQVEVTGEIGNIIRWEVSINSGGFAPIPSSANDTLFYTPGGAGTYAFRAVAQSGICPTAFSTTTTLTVTNVAAGSLSVTTGTNPQCITGNSFGITRSGGVGTTTRWDTASTAMGPWTNVAAFNNLNVVTLAGLPRNRFIRVRVIDSLCADTSTGLQLQVTPTTVAGAINVYQGSDNLCSGTNSFKLRVTGYTGTVTKWVFSATGNAPFTDVANTTDSLIFNASITATRFYRAILQSGTCSPETTAAFQITVSPASAGGTGTRVSAATICPGVTATVSNTTGGPVGTLVQWEYRVGGSGPYTALAGSAGQTTFSFIPPVPGAYEVRAVRQSGVCPTANSTNATFTVTNADAGILSLSQSFVCGPTNSTTLTRVGGNGGTQRWDVANDSLGPWAGIAGTDNLNAITITNLTATRWYRLRVTQSGCNDTSTPVRIQFLTGSIGGTAGPSRTVCNIANSGRINLTGFTGTILGWISSPTGLPGSWTPIPNTTDSLLFTNLATTTRFAARVQQGSCPVDTSTSAIITVSPSVAGNITAVGASTICSGTNNFKLRLTDFNGTIQKWYFSQDGLPPFTDVPASGDSLTFSGTISNNRVYRAITQLGACAPDTAAPLTLTVNPVSFGGTVGQVRGNNPECATANSGRLDVSGFVGSVVRWERSTDGGTSWSPIANVTDSLIYTNLTQTTLYRAVVQSGVCPEANSASITINVDPASVAGSISGGGTFCSGTLTSRRLSLTGYTGTVQNWQTSIDGGANWANLSPTNTTDSLILTAPQLTSAFNTTTLYRAIVKSGVCVEDTSASVSITINPTSLGGTTTLVSGTLPACANSNNFKLRVTGYRGAVQGWIFRLPGNGTWTPVANTTDSLSATNIPSTRIYRAIIQSGICAVDTSTAFQVNIDSTTLGGSLSGGTTVCNGTNSTLLTLSGRRGTIQDWIVSTNGGTTWASVGHTGITYTATNLTTGSINTTYTYAVIVRNGTCPAETSATTAIIVNPTSIGGTTIQTLGNDTVCNGVNSFTLQVTGFQGAVQRWQVSTNGGGSYADIAVATSSLSRTNITQTSLFRAVIRSGVCPEDFSTPFQVVVNATSVGGTTSGDQQVCSGASGVVTLSGNVGRVVRWESSTTGGPPWTNIANTTTTLPYTNLTTSTYYRALVQNDPCVAVYSSNTAFIQIANPATPTNTTSLGAICADSTKLLTVSTLPGTRVDWYDQPTGGTPLATNTTTFITPFLTTSATFYAEAISNSAPSCTSLTRRAIIVNVNPRPNPDIVSSRNAYVPFESANFNNNGAQFGNTYQWRIEPPNPNIIFLTPTNGTIFRVFFDGNVSGFYNIILTQRAGGPTFCFQRDTFLIQVDTCPVNVGTGINVSFATGTTAICRDEKALISIDNGATFSLINWQDSSATSSGAWVNIPGVGNTRTFNTDALVQETWYRAILSGGTCQRITPSRRVPVVDPPFVANILAVTPSVCEGDRGIIRLDTTIGNIEWQISGDTTDGDGGLPWYNINTLPANISNALTAGQGSLIGGIISPNGRELQTQNLPAGKFGKYYFRARIFSDCRSLTTAQVRLEVSPPPTGNFIPPVSTICNNGRVAFRSTRTSGNGTWSCTNCQGFLSVVNQDSANYIAVAADAGNILQFRYSITQPGCPSIIVDRNISVDAAPNGTFNTIIPTLCRNDSTAPLNATATIGTGRWATNGFGTFVNPLSPTSRYRASADDTALTNVELYWRVGNGVCDTVVYTQRFAVVPFPSGSFLPIQSQVCVNTSTDTLRASILNNKGQGTWSSTGTGTFLPTITSPLARYVPSPADAGQTVSLTWSVNNGTCASASYTRQVLVNPLSDGNFNTVLPDICPLGTTIPLNAGRVNGIGAWSCVNCSNGAFSFADSTNPNTTFTAAEADSGRTITLRWTVVSGVCQPDTQSRTVNVTDRVVQGTFVPPFPSICEGDVSPPLGATTRSGEGNWTIIQGNGFLDNPTDPNTRYNSPVGDRDSIILRWTVFSSTCGNSKAYQEGFRIRRVPKGSFSIPQQPICMNGQTVALGATVTEGQGTWSTTAGNPGVFLPNVNDPNAVFIPDASHGNLTNLHLRWTISANGCNDVFFEQPIRVDSLSRGTFATAPDTICVEEPTAPLNATLSTTLRNVSGRWERVNGFGGFTDNSDPNARYIPLLADTGRTIVLRWIVTNGVCAADTYAQNLFVRKRSLGAFGTTIPPVCEGTTTIPLNAQAFNGVGLWSAFSPLGITGTFSSNTDPNATYRPTAGEGGTTSSSTTTLIWTVQSGDCTPVSYTRTVGVFAPSAGGITDTTTIRMCFDQSLSPTLTAFAGPGTGVWTEDGAGSVLNNLDGNTRYQVALADTNKIITLTWTVINGRGEVGACAPVAFQRRIYVRGVPLGGFTIPQPNVCQSEPTLPLGAVLTNPNSFGFWRSTGPGSFIPNSSDPNARYQPTMTEQGLQQLTWVVYTGGECDTARYVQNLEVFPVSAGQLVDVNSIDSVCFSQQQTAFLGGSRITTFGDVGWLSDGSGFFPTPTNGNSVYRFGAQDTNRLVTLTWFVISGAGPYACDTAKYSKKIFIRAVPDGTFANAPLSVCELTPTEPLGATLVKGIGTWSTNKAGTFSNVNDPNATYTPAVGEGDGNTGVTVLTWRITTGNQCSPLVFTQNLTVFAPSNGDVARRDTTDSLCFARGSTDPLGASRTTTTGPAFWTHNGNGFYTSVTDPNARYVFAQSDTGKTVLLTWNVVSGTGPYACDTAKYSRSVFVRAVPVGSFPTPPQPVCELSPTAPLGATLGDGQGTWSSNKSGTFSNPNDPNATYTPAAGEGEGNTSITTLTWTVSTGNQCLPTPSYSQNLRVYAPSLGVVTTALLDTFCFEDVTSTVLGGLALTTAGPSFWTVTSGDGFVLNPSNGNSVYQFAPTDTNRVVTLTWTVINGDTTPGSGTACAPAIYQKQLFVRKVTAQAQVLNPVDGIPMMPDGASIPICVDSTVTLRVLTNFGNRYRWSGDGIPEIQRSLKEPRATPPAGTTIYTCLVTDTITGCSQLTQVTVRSDNRDTMRINGQLLGDTTVCRYAAVWLTATPGFSNYQWTTDDNTATIETPNSNQTIVRVNQAGRSAKFFVSARNQYACSLTDNFTVSLFPSIQPAVQMQDNCEGRTQRIISVSPAPATLTYWFHTDSANIANAGPFDPTNVHFILGSTNQPIISVTDTLFTTGGPIANFLNLEGGDTIRDKTFTYYFLSLDGCETVSQGTFRLIRNPQARFVASTFRRRLDDILQISPTPTNDISDPGSRGDVINPVVIRIPYLFREVQFRNLSNLFPSSKPDEDTSIYLWDFGDPASGDTANRSLLRNPVHEFSGPGTYSITLNVANNLNCNDIRVRSGYIIVEEPKYFLPTAFSPNNDGVNDTFRVLPLLGEAEILTFEVYDRNLQRIWQLESKPTDADPNTPDNWRVLDVKGWDGRNSAGNPADPGNYSYKVVLKDNVLGVREYTGIINLVR